MPRRIAVQPRPICARPTTGRSGHVSVDQRPEIENLLAEGRTFPPDPAFTAQANATGRAYEEAARDPEAFWAKIAREPSLDRAVRDDPRVGPAVREVVRRRQAQHQPTTASTATSSAASATRSPTTGSASRATRGRSPTPTSSARCRRRPTPCSSSGCDRRPGRDLHADDPGAADRDARLRPDRRARIPSSSAGSRRRRSRSDQRRRGEAGHHRRRRLAPGQAGAAQAGGRRGRSPRARRSSTS